MLEGTSRRGIMVYNYEKRAIDEEKEAEEVRDNLLQEAVGIASNDDDDDEEEEEGLRRSVSRLQVSSPTLSALVNDLPGQYTVVGVPNPRENLLAGKENSKSITNGKGPSEKAKTFPLLLLPACFFGSWAFRPARRKKKA